MNRDPLNRSDWRLFAVCAAVVAGSLFVVFNWFNTAFPEAAIEFKLDRESSQPVAQTLLGDLHAKFDGTKHAASFSSDDDARIFLERSIGLEKTRAVTKRDVHLWAWHHRWFKPLQVEEWNVDVTPTGEIIGYSDKLLEEDRLPDVDARVAQLMAESFLRHINVNVKDLNLVSTSERQLKHRTQRIYTYESQSIHPAGAPYRTIVTVDGNRVTNYAQRLHVPDEWTRSYNELRSKNSLASMVDLVFLAITIVCIVVVFIDRLRRGDVAINTLLGFAAVAFVLTTGVALNSFPSYLAAYDTVDSYPLFLARFAFLRVIIPAFGETMFLVVLIGAGEPLYRERFQKHLAIPRLWTRRALQSKRVFQSFIIGYALVAFFLAYQVAFYLIANHFGAWSPAEVPYDEMLKTRFPWIGVLFAGFFPAMREEFMSRAFSIPFFERVMRSRVAAVVVAAFIWGFGHSMYANQPFYIRGVEVGLAGVLIGALMYRFGLLPLLIWHYTVDAGYTALLMLRSGNQYYVISGALSACVFAIPMIASIVLYVRNKGFVADDDLNNETIPTAPPLPPEPRVKAPLPPAIPVTRTLVITAIVAVAIAAILIARAPATLDKAVDYRITRDQAVDTAMKFLASQHQQPLAKRTGAPSDGFRTWDSDDPAEDGGKPTGDFDHTSAEYLLHHGLSVSQVVDILRTRIHAATWMVRTYTPQQKREYFIEVDPRTSRVIGFHRYQEERALGARLEEAQARDIARATFAQYGLDLAQFDLKETLNFQQPNRRDWLFHFQERTPVVADAWRRVSVRVAGSEVSQFAITVHIPDEVRRADSASTFMNFFLFGLQIAGVLTLMSLVVAGLVIVTRNGNFPWRDALRVLAFLAIVPLWKAGVGIILSPWNYGTSMEWSTFIGMTATLTVRDVALELGKLFLALAALKAVYPVALDLHHRDARAHFGRSAVVSAIAAIAILLSRDLIVTLIENAYPTMIRVGGIGLPHHVVVPLPAILSIGNAVVRAIEFSAVIALFVYALKPMSKAPWVAPLLTIASITFLQFDTSVNVHELPLMLFDAFSYGIVAWLIVRYVLLDNLLAYPVTLTLLFLLKDATTMLHNHRPDLQANAIAVIAAAIALVGWMSVRSWTEPQLDIST